MRRARAVAVVGAYDDVHTRHVARAVERAGGRALVLDTSPRAALSFEDGHVAWDGHALDDVSSFFVKSVQLALPAPSLAELVRSELPTWSERYYAERERWSLSMSALAALALDGERTFVNAPDAIGLHLTKPLQGERLRALGLPVPSSLSTNVPAAARSFARRHGEVIAKPLSGGAPAELFDGDERAELLAYCPVLLQERVLGDEHRAYVLDGEPLASFRVPTDGAVDARENLDRVEPCSLDELAWQLCLDCARALELTFTAVDLRRTRAGEWVVLECNPTPAISFYEDPVHGVVANELARFLVERA